MNISFVLNGKPTSVDVEPSMLLCDLLRETLSADRHACRLRHQPMRRLRRACGRQLGEELHVAGGRSRRRTASPRSKASARPTALHPMQLAFHENHGLQCGFCTPGMLMSSVEFAKRHPRSDRGRRAPLARRQSLPLHRISEHRQPRSSRGTAAMHAATGSISMSNVIGIGARPLRKEDQRFLTGRGNYVADIKRPDMTMGVFVRSPHAHAAIKSIDAAAALAMPGVLARVHRRRSQGRRRRRHCPAAGASPARTACR